MTTDTSDERVRAIPRLSRLLSRPELGAVAGTLLVLVFFAVTAGGSGLYSAKGIINFLEVSAQLGILAAPVALLMIAGEFDLSIGSMIGFAGIVIAIPTVDLGLADRAGAAPQLRALRRLRLSQRPHRGEDRTSLLHRDARQPVHAARPDAGHHARRHRPHPGIGHP